MLQGGPASCSWGCRRLTGAQSQHPGPSVLSHATLFPACSALPPRGLASYLGLEQPSRGRKKRTSEGSSLGQNWEVGFLLVS